MTRNYCDRCEVLIPDHSKGKHLFVSPAPVQNEGLGTQSIVISKDKLIRGHMCLDCSDDFDNWMERKRVANRLT